MRVTFAMKLYTNTLLPVFFFLFVVLAIPILLWLQVQTISTNSIYSILAGFGEIAGITGTVLFSIGLLLSARPAFLEKIFHGLNALYDYHSKIGQIAVILLLFHPLLLLARYTTTTLEATRFFSFTANWQQDLGLAALYLTIVVIVLTLYIRPKYTIWKYVHKFLGVALFLGALHIYFIPSFVLNSSVALKTYVLGWVLFALSVWLYRSVFGNKFVAIYEYKVSNITKLNDAVTSIEMCPIKEKMNFVPGQFVFISFEGAQSSREPHPFSLTSLPTDDCLNVSIKALGDYTSTIAEKVKMGDRVFVEGPFGTFSYKGTGHTKQIWIAGGIGITPFISLVQDLFHAKSHEVHMYYAVRNKKEAVYLSFLEKIASLLENFSITPFYSDTKNYLTPEYILANTTNSQEYDILICAPPKMIESFRKKFRKLGITRKQLISEEFDF